MNNIIDAICNLVENPRTELIRKGDSHNRANSMGEALEEYIKDLFAGVSENTSDEMRDELIQGTFSYTGNQSNPPDAMLWGGNKGDAIEVKKIESPTSALALNSSYPKHKLYATSSMISTVCRECEDWTERDIIYAVGIVGKTTEKLESLAFVYGEDYCASKDYYFQTISDPMNVASTDISKAIWTIKNPFEVFSDIYHIDEKNKFNFMAIINDSKFEKLNNSDNLNTLSNKNKNLKITDIKIRNPNNPKIKNNAKLITFSLEAV